MNSEQRTKRSFLMASKWLIVPIAAVYLGLSYLSVQRGNSLLIGIVLVLLSIIPFLLRFERKERKARELMLIAVMAAVATVSRIPFATLLPNFTPVTFVVIVSGVVFGAEAGWMVGAATALVSNFFLGQGPWTPWQMFAWGMAGYTAGLFAHRSLWRRERLPLALFGLAWGFLFGWIMNITLALDQWVQTHSWEAVVGKYVTGLPFEVVHATANVFFILAFSPSWIALLERYRRKYGTLERTELTEGEQGNGQTSAAI
ncbi:ECF transporter S component [Cohnella lupini]|uniref:Energy-coupling factor transport system substrate-specific component n=1 Tax=Cohnella lupini TaxID=1294267 RepID=A0A3D9HUM9_9BACL|nr:ECF transporter S component [Cohnella lupini]RED53177.1 energy-coupling factor transport system substrate-specific component [Cohnella lupini]